MIAHPTDSTMMVSGVEMVIAPNLSPATYANGPPIEPKRSDRIVRFFSQARLWFKVTEKSNQSMTIHNGVRGKFQPGLLYKIIPVY